MKKRYCQSICVILTFALLVNVFFVRAADVSVSLEDALASAGSICEKAVGTPEFGSEWFLYCFTAADYKVPSTYKKAYYDALCAHLKACDGVLDTRKYTEYARVILALTALGYDPANVAGYDLTLPLADFDATVKQGLNGAVSALLALDSGCYAIPAAPKGKTQATREGYLSYILEKQLPDGGFSVNGKRADVDTTAMALQALAKYTGRQDVDTAVKAALSYLLDVQLPSGGFENWGTENSESCAQVILALCELGIPLDDERFAKEGKTLLDVLLSYRDAEGGFRHTKDGKTDMLALRQVYMAMAALWRAENGKSSFYSIGMQFYDIAGHPDCAAIAALARAGMISGRGDGTFDPDATMTRVEFCALIVRGIGEKPIFTQQFEDVPDTAWFAEYVGAAYEKGIVKGVGEHTFNPYGIITDSEAEVMVARAARLLKIEPTTSEVWHASSVRITRGAVARMLYDLLSSAGLL